MWNFNDPGARKVSLSDIQCEEQNKAGISPPESHLTVTLQMGYERLVLLESQGCGACEEARRFTAEETLRKP